LGEKGGRERYGAWRRGINEGWAFVVDDC